MIFQNVIILVTFFMLLLGIIFTVHFWVEKYKGTEEKGCFWGQIALTLGIVALGYGFMVMSKHYSVDSFNLIFDMSPYWHMQLGRYVNCGIILIALHFGINQVVYQQIFLAVWIITLASMLCVITDAIKKCILNLDRKKQIVLTLAIGLAFVNVFAMELMLFPEMAMVFILGNLTLGLAVWYALEDGKAVKKWGLCIAFLVISIGNYQSYIGIFEAFTLVGIFLKWNNNVKKRYQESAIALVIGGGVAVFNVLLTKVLIKCGYIADSGRGAVLDWETISDNLIGVLRYQISFWKDADGIFPVAIMPVVAIALLCIVISAVMQQKTWEKKIFLLLILCGCYLLGYAPHIVEHSLILSPRSNIAVWSVISVVFVMGINYMPEKMPIAFYVENNILIGIFVLNIFVMQDMAANEQAMNAIDITEAGQICDKVREYESETGNTIVRVAARGDCNSTYYQSMSRYHNWELGARIMATYYSNYRLIGYELGRTMERVDMSDEIYQKYFDGKDWEQLNVDEQVVCDGDTLYLCVY